jgi:hypothetical protein
LPTGKGRCFWGCVINGRFTLWRTFVIIEHWLRRAFLLRREWLRSIPRLGAARRDCAFAFPLAIAKDGSSLRLARAATRRGETL